MAPTSSRVVRFDIACSLCPTSLSRIPARPKQRQQNRANRRRKARAGLPQRADELRRVYYAGVLKKPRQKPEADLCALREIDRFQRDENKTIIPKRVVDLVEQETKEKWYRAGTGG